MQVPSRDGWASCARWSSRTCPRTCCSPRSPSPPASPRAIALLLGRFALSQMDIPTRQAYVVAVVDPSERTATAAYTNAARTLACPAAPLLAGAALRAGLGAPS